ncbi:uncharacterized protein B0T23DRAFT_403208 [Neurospora hispaniola]|uniref:Uncharacterized protein n=1 Tax=Neurospora hispaniola TaxID=588809 RepID=A0AAJ0MRY8_9PEZI|nr:hypothetical protein B0T23DRAFT_403208 [Neurospora hispaniola]
MPVGSRVKEVGADSRSLPATFGFKTFQFLPPSSPDSVQIAKAPQAKKTPTSVPAFPTSVLIPRAMSNKPHGPDAASQAATAKKQKSPTLEPPGLKPRSVEAVATPAFEDHWETVEDDDDYWSGEEDFVFEIMSEEEIQEKADRLREEIRVALCNGLVWKPSCVKGNSSVTVEVKADHYQVANWAFGGSRNPSDETWGAMDYPTEAFNEDFGPIHNLTGSTPLALTGTHVRINLYHESWNSMEYPWQQTIAVIVSASYGTQEARDRLQDTDVCPSDLEGMFSSEDDYVSVSGEDDGEKAYHEEETEDTGRLNPSVH